VDNFPDRLRLFDHGHLYNSSCILDDLTHRDTLVVMPFDEIEKITLAHNKIFAVMSDPDVREVFGNGYLSRQEDSLPEIQVGEGKPNIQRSSK
jgi:hypothetical protein